MRDTLVEAVLEYANSNPNKPAVCFRNEIVSYGELKRRVDVAVCHLKEYGIKQGEPVLLTAVSKPEYVVGLLAIQHIGAIAVPVDKAAKKDSLQKVKAVVSPKLLLSDTQTMEGVPRESLKKFFLGEAAEEPAYHKPQGGDIMEILFSTGTTGNPKGAMLSAESLCANIHNTWKGIGMESEDVVLLPLPLNHSFGMRVLRTALYIGATVVLQNGFSFAQELENNINKFSCNALVSVPSSMEIILGQLQDRAAEVLGKLRYIEISAGSLNPRMRKKVLKLLPSVELHNTWGSTESGGALFLNLSEHPDKIFSIGKPLDHIALKILDENQQEIQEASSSCVGRMAIRGEMQMTGYWGQKELTAETICDGWLMTSDMVYRDDDGYIYMTGRADDIINVGGEKVSPLEVENVAYDYEGIRECACIGVKDEEGMLGEVPVLYVVPTASYKENECIEYLSERLEKIKVPTKCILMDELPKNQMKKLDRKALKQHWEMVGDMELINPIVQNILSRRSIRRFSDKRIPRPLLEMLCKTGYYAPSGHNTQSWRFTVVDAPETVAYAKEIIRRTAKANDVYFYGFENPAGLIFISNDRRNPYGKFDVACAAENIMLAAHSYGLGSVWLNPLMEICDEPDVRKLLNDYHVPQTHIVWATIALGYPVSEGNMLAKKEDVVYFVDKKEVEAKE